MKRTTILLLLFILICVNGIAGNPFKESGYEYILNTKPIEFIKGQKQYGDLSALKDEQSIYVFYYTDDAIYNNHPIIYTRKEFSDEKIRLQTEEKICNKFIEGANDRTSKNFYFSGNHISRFIMKLHITSIDPDGETNLYAMIFDTKSQKLIFQKKFNANGGDEDDGDLFDLMGIAAEKLGKKVGTFFWR